MWSKNQKRATICKYVYYRKVNVMNCFEIILSFLPSDSYKRRICSRQWFLLKIWPCDKNSPPSYCNQRKQWAIANLVGYFRFWPFDFNVEVTYIHLSVWYVIFYHCSLFPGVNCALWSWIRRIQVQFIPELYNLDRKCSI